jgi:Glycosyltransferase family 87
VLLISLLFAGSLWFYVERVLIPYQEADAAAHNRPRGILSDLYPRWLGARELLLRQRDPYSAEVTRDIQIGYYGRALDPKRPNDPTDHQAFAYPVYVVFLLAPTIKLPFALVQAGFRCLMVGLIIVTVLFWMRFLKWRPSTATGIAVLALTFGCFPVAQGLLLEQLTIVVSVLVAACLLLLCGEQFLLAGILLAIASIKPQLIWPLGAWLCLWSLSDWRKRQNFFWGFSITGILLATAGELVLHNWIGRFRLAVDAYRQYTGTQSIFEKLTSPTLGTLINYAVLLVVAVVCWRARKVSDNSTQFVLVSSLVLAATIVTVSTIAPYNQIFLLPAALILIKNWKELWNANHFIRAACWIGAAFLVWPWLSSFALLSASMFVPPALIQKAWWVPMASSLAIPPSVLGLYGLYMRRAL